MSLETLLYSTLKANATIRANVGSKRDSKRNTIYAIGHIQSPSISKTPSIAYKVDNKEPTYSANGNVQDTGHRTGMIEITVEVAPEDSAHGEKMITLENTISDLLTSTTFIQDSTTHNVAVRSCRLNTASYEDGNSVPGREPNHKFLRLIFDVGYFDTERLLS